MPDQNLINRIRTIFLHLRPHVSIAEGTVLLGWSRGEMSRAIAAGEVEVTSTSLDRWIWREELMAKAVELWSAEMIEEALGAQADAVLPDGVRLTDACGRAVVARGRVCRGVALAGCRGGDATPLLMIWRAPAAPPLQPARLGAQLSGSSPA